MSELLQNHSDHKLKEKTPYLIGIISQKYSTKHISSVILLLFVIHIVTRALS